MQTSAKKAAEIAARRIKKCDDILENLEKELNLVEGWKKQAQTLTRDKSECIEPTCGPREKITREGGCELCADYKEPSPDNNNRICRIKECSPGYIITPDA